MTSTEAARFVRDTRSRKIAIAAAIALAVALLAAEVSLMALNGGDWSSWGTLALGAGAMMLIGGLGARFLFLRRREDAGDIFRQIAEASPLPAALSDARGRLVTMNPAMRREAGGAKPRRPIGDAIASLAPGAEAAAYRLGNQALETGMAAARIALATGAFNLLTARRIADDHLVWTLAPAPQEALSHDAGAHFWALLGPDGAEVTRNAAFAALDADARAALRRAAFAAAQAGDGACSVHLADGRDVEIALHGRPSEALSIIGFARVPPTPEGDGSHGEERLFEDLPVALARLDFDGRIVRVNEPAKRLLGDAAGPGTPLTKLAEGLSRPLSARIAEAAAGRGAGRQELARAVAVDDAEERYLHISLTRIEGGGAAAGELLALISDATDLRTLEQQFVQSQKMQAVGQLAGGVAHDFNNLLTAILGHCDLMGLRMEENDPDFADLTQIRQNANRAAALVRQLLAFSRRQKLSPAACRLQDSLEEVSILLDRLIGEQIILTVDCEPHLWPVWLDAQQFEQVVINLVVNARDAMPDGGEISIRCRNITLDAEEQRDRAVVPVGDYVEIEIADEGVGMSPTTLAQIFQPFFTTKQPGEGTGLGLATAYGIVKQTEGFIFADSAEGQGTTFRILIPRLDMATVTAHVDVEEARSSEDLTGAGRVLLVEDEAPVRAFALRALTLRGYDVVEAEDAEGALAAMASDPGFDLVISDVVMPGMDGPTWVREARRRHPQTPVIFTSGYDEGLFRNGFDDIPDCHFLPKPFSLEALAKAVKARIARAQVDA